MLNPLCAHHGWARSGKIWGVFKRQNAILLDFYLLQRQERAGQGQGRGGPGEDLSARQEIIVSPSKMNELKI